MPVPMSVDIHGRGSPFTVISRVASAVAEDVSVARTTNELRPAEPDGGVPESVPSMAKLNHAGPLTF